MVCLSQAHAKGVLSDKDKLSEVLEKGVVLVLRESRGKLEVAKGAKQSQVTFLDNNFNNFLDAVKYMLEMDVGVSQDSNKWVNVGIITCFRKQRLRKKIVSKLQPIVTELLEEDSFNRAIYGGNCTLNIHMQLKRLWNLNNIAQSHIFEKYCYVLYLLHDQDFDLYKQFMEKENAEVMGLLKENHYLSA